MVSSAYAPRFFVAVFLEFLVNTKIIILYIIYFWVIFSPSENQIRRCNMMSGAGREVNMHFVLLDPWG